MNETYQFRPLDNFERNSYEIFDAYLKTKRVGVSETEHATRIQNAWTRHVARVEDHRRPRD